MEDEYTFEDCLLKLESIVSKLESGKETLKESLKLYEDGMMILKTCAEKLKLAEQKIFDVSATDVPLNIVENEPEMVLLNE